MSDVKKQAPSSNFEAIARFATEESQPPTRLQFSLRSVMLATVVVSVVCALLFSFPPAIAAVVSILVQPFVAAALLSGVVFAKGERRFFCVGAIIPTVLSLFSNTGGFNVGGYWYLMMLSRGYGSGVTSGGSNDFGDYLNQIFDALQKSGYPMMLQAFFFLTLTFFCGVIAVWSRRYWLKQAAVPAALVEGEVGHSNQDGSAMGEER